MRRILLFACSWPALACVQVDGDRILARHLAQANPVFAGLEGNIEIGFAPRARITRVFRAEQQAQLARKHQMALAEKLTDVCFVGAGESSTASKHADREVERGEKVAVEVSSGSTRLTFEAEAASAGRMGESVVVKNPENGRLFSAKVQGKGKVVIQR